MALLTFGEGYHNFHHEFQHDYRNGAKPWQFDPTKWTIWLLSRVGLIRQLRRVPEQKILLAEIAEQRRQLQAHLSARPAAVPETVHGMLENAQQRLQQAFQHWELRKTEYYRAAQLKMDASRDRLAQLQRELHEATAQFQAAVREWQEARQLAVVHIA
jgi:stearoyl-CoA desaturase (Delta-9 desaturase)